MQNEGKIRNTKQELLLFETLVAGFPRFILFLVDIAVFFWFLAKEPPSESWPPHPQDFWITHNDAPLSVGLLWTSDQLVAETST